MTTAGATLFAARLESQNVVPPSSSSGSGTGVFVLSSKDRRPMLVYQVSYANLSTPEVRSITLRNFGAGKEGAVVHVICGIESQQCPSGSDGTVYGQWSDERRLPLTPRLLTELANRRIYVEIETARGREIRSQLGANPFMVMADEAQVDLHGSGKTESADGTAAIRLVHFPNRVELGILLTVARAGADPTSVMFTSESKRFEPIRLKRSTEAKPGRTLRIVATGRDFKALSTAQFVQAMTSGEVSLVVFLGKGEQNSVGGKLMPVR